MTEFREYARQMVRRYILTILSRADQYCASDQLIAHALRHVYGAPSSIDAVRSELAWLTEQGLATIESERPVTIARLTERGFDAAENVVRVPGVAPARPVS